MGLFQTQGLILKTYSLAEADKIVVILTQHQGLVRGVAKGAKRPKSKFGSCLEPFSIVQVEYFQKEDRELVSIKNLELVRSFFGNASNPQFLNKFAYLAQLLTEFAPPNDPNENLFRMAKVCLETAVDSEEYLDNIGLYFELWILRLGGYLPNWNRCDNCGKDFGKTEETTLQINFHLLCKACQKTKNNWVIKPIHRQIFHSAQRLSPIKFVEFTSAEKERAIEVSDALKRIISHILGKEINPEKALIPNFGYKNA